MALKSTIYKAGLQVNDLDRNYYQLHALTLALHPSETPLRMMLRLLVFACNASQRLAFTKGISSEDQPDLWVKGLSGEIELWIDLGQPDEKRIRKACGRARQVLVYAYKPRSAEIWWQQKQTIMQRFGNLRVFYLHVADVDGLERLVDRNMNLQCMIQDDRLWLSSDDNSVEITTEVWK